MSISANRIKRCVKSCNLGKIFVEIKPLDGRKDKVSATFMVGNGESWKGYNDKIKNGVSIPLSKEVEKVLGIAYDKKSGTSLMVDYRELFRLNFDLHEYNKLENLLRGLGITINLDSNIKKKLRK